MRGGNIADGGLLPHFNKQDWGEYWESRNQHIEGMHKPGFWDNLRNGCNCSGQPHGFLLDCPVWGFVEGEEEREMLAQLKNLQIDKRDLDDIVAIHTFGVGMVSTYQANDLEVPQWLRDNLDALKREMSTRRDESLLAALKEAESQQAALKTAEEKRKDVAEKVAALRAKLGR